MKSRPSHSVHVAAREWLARRILLRRKATRLELSHDTGLCAASVTKHTRWLLKHGFLTSTPIRIPDVKRPVDQLRVNARQGTALALLVCHDQVDGQVLGLDGQVLAEFAAPVEHPTQHGVLAAVSAATNQAREWAMAHGRPIDLAGMSVRGTVASEDGIVFGLDGVPQWRPCQPKLMLPAMQGIPVLQVWTQVMSKIVSLSALEGREDRFGYVEFLGRSFHIAVMREGEVKMGGHGTTSSSLHESVSEDGPLCYCGRRGCLADLLESNRPLDERVLSDAFIRFLNRIKVDALGLEWQGDQDGLQRRLTESGFKVSPISNGHELAARGLRMLIAQSLLARKLASGATVRRRTSVRRQVAAQGS